MKKQAVAVILKSPQGHYALQLRDDKPGINSPGKWGLFGGHIEKDELPLSAAIREIREELGVELNPDRVEFFTTVTDHENGLIDILIYVYEAVRPLGETLGEGQAIRWFSASEMADEHEDIVEAHLMALSLERLHQKHGI